MKKQSLYLHDILERIRLIEEFTADGREAYMESALIQEGVIRCFEVIGEVVKRLSPELTSSYPDIPWRRIAGLRDVLIHNYDETDVDVIWRVIEQDLTPLKAAVESLLEQVTETEKEDNSD